MNFAEHIEKMMRQTLGVDEDEAVDEEEEVICSLLYIYIYLYLFSA